MKLRTLTFLILICGFAYGTHRLIVFLVPTPLTARDTASTHETWSNELRKDSSNPGSLSYGFNKVVEQAAVESAGNAPHDTEATRIQAYLDRFSGNPLADAEVIEQAFGQLSGRENQTTRALLLRTLAAEVVEVEHRPLVRGLALKEVKTSLSTLHSAAARDEDSMDVQYHLQSMYELYLDHTASEGRDLLLDAGEVIQSVQDPSAQATLSAIYMSRFPDRAAEMRSHLKGIGVDVPELQARPLAPEAVLETVD